MSYKQTGSSKILERLEQEFKQCYKITAKLVQNGKSDLLADSHSILNRWKNHSCQLLNVHEFKHIRQTEIHTPEILLPKSSAVQVEMTNKKLKSYKSPWVIQSSGKLICSEIYDFINSIWKLLNSLRILLQHIIIKVIKLTVIITVISYTQKILSYTLLLWLTPHIHKITEDHHCEFEHNRLTADTTLWIHQALEKKCEYSAAIYQS